MRDKMKKVWLPILFILSVIAVIYYIFAYSAGQMHSDTASKVLFASQQHLKHQYFPDGFCYSTGVFVFGIENIIYLLMFFIKDWMLCREVAQLVQTILLILSMFLFFYFVSKEKKDACIGGMISTVLFILPLSKVVYDLYYYQAVYSKNVVLLLLTFAVVGKIIFSDKSRKQWIWFVLLAVVTILNNFGIRNVMVVEFPLIVAVLICGFDFSEKKFKLLFKEKLIIGISGIGTITGFFIYQMITRYVGWNNQTEIAGFVSPEVAIQHVGHVFKVLFQIYGVGGKAALISLTGITLPFKMLYMIISVAIVPIFWLFAFKKIENKCWKIVVCYSWISNLCMTYLFIATSAGGAEEQHHFLTVYVNNTILLAGFLLYMWKNSSLVAKRCLAVCVIFYVLLVNVAYINESNPAMEKQENADEEMIQYLKDNDLDFGYATFWNAYKYTMLSNGEIQILGYSEQPNTPYYWLTSKDWYKPDYHEGRTFILVNHDAPEQEIDEKYYQTAERVDRVGKYTILIYPQNILLYTELMYDTLQEGSVRDIAMKDLGYSGNSYQYDNNIVLKNGGMQYGPYLNLDSGTYQVCVEGKNLKNAEVEVSLNPSHDRKNVEIQEQADDKVVYQFSLEKTASDVEFLTFNSSEGEVEIDKMTIECLKNTSEAYFPLQLKCTGNAYYDGGNLILGENGEEYGPYDDLEAGSYEVKISGENLDLAEFSVTAEAGDQNIAIEHIEINENMVVYTFKLDEQAEGMEYHIYNNQNEEVVIKRLSVAKEE